MVQLVKIQEHLLELLLDQIHRHAAVHVVVILPVVIVSYQLVKPVLMVQLAKIQEHLLELWMDQIHRRAAVRAVKTLLVAIVKKPIQKLKVANVVLFLGQLILQIKKYVKMLHVVLV